MKIVVEYISLILSLIFFIPSFSVLFSRYNQESLIEVQNKNFDLRLMIKFCMFLLLVVGSFELYNVIDLKRKLENEECKSRMLSLQKMKLDSINLELERKNEDYFQSILDTQYQLQDIITNKQDITREIGAKVVSCFRDAEELEKISKRSIKLIRKMRSEFDASNSNDSCKFSYAEIEYYRKSLDILENNAVKTMKTFKYIQSKLKQILNLARQLNLRNSSELYTAIDRGDKTVNLFY